MAAGAETFEFEDAEVQVETETGKFETKALPGATEGPRDLSILRQRAAEATAAGASAASAPADAGKNPDDPIDRVQALLMGGRGLEADEVEFLDEARAKKAAKLRATQRALEAAEDEFDAQLRSRVVSTGEPVAGIEVRGPGGGSSAPSPPAAPRRLADPSPDGPSASSSVARLLKRPRASSASSPKERAGTDARRAGDASRETSSGEVTLPKRQRRQPAPVASRAVAALGTYASDSGDDDSSDSE